MGQNIGAGIAEIRKLATTVDSGVSVTLNFGSESLPLIQELLKIKDMDTPVMVAFVRADDV